MGGPQDAQRKAWNEAMKSAAGAAALPSTLANSLKSRRSDRRKKQARREKARKFTASNINDESSQEYRAAVWMDTLEGVNTADAAHEHDAAAEEEEEYDELEELDSKQTKRKRRSSIKKKTAGVLPKRFKNKSLASILMEEANQPYGVSRDFIQAEATLPKNQQVKPRKFCPVTGLFGIYTDPKSGIPYANQKALEQIQERAPPWMNLSGTATYLETTKSLTNTE